VYLLSDIKRKLLVLLLLFFTTNLIAQTQEQVVTNDKKNTPTIQFAKIPYPLVYRMVTAKMPYLAVQNSTLILINISSILKTVSKKDIKLTLTTNTKKYSLQQDDDGSFYLPLNKKFIAKNAVIVTNQPKGTLELKFNYPHYFTEDNFSLKDGKVRYASLVQFFQVMQKLHNKVTHKKINDSNYYEAVFHKAQKLPFTIHSKEKNIVVPYQKGKKNYLFPKSENLLKENPWVSFPEPLKKEGLWTDLEYEVK
jgi:hypothetical protein